MVEQSKTAGRMIRVTDEVFSKLKQCKQHPRETWGDIVGRAVDHLIIGKS